MNLQEYEEWVIYVETIPLQTLENAARIAEQKKEAAEALSAAGISVQTIETAVGNTEPTESFNRAEIATAAANKAIESLVDTGFYDREELTKRVYAKLNL